MDNQLEQQIALINEMLEIGEQLLTIGSDFELTETVLSLMTKRGELFEAQSNIETSVDVEADSEVLSRYSLQGKQELDEVVQRLIVQNDQLQSILNQHLDWIGKQRDLTETALKANRRYQTTDYVKSIARGLQVDESL